jgi:hypothetical protein
LAEPFTPIPHATAKCCWCQGPLYLIDAHYWCATLACRQVQMSFGIGAKVLRGKKEEWLYVPTPKQCEFERVARTGAGHGQTMHVLYGGAAGGAKSHAARWSMYRRAFLIPGYEGLLLRRTFPELEKTHLRRMARECQVFKEKGWGVEFLKTDKRIEFKNGSLIECGHMDDEDAVSKYLSTEYDDIVPDEASVFHPQPLLELSTRARSTKAAVLAAGGPWFRPVTNPGGPASRMLLDFFIDHTPDFDQFPALRTFYRPDEWVYIEAKLEDNPYLGPGYEGTLAILEDARYRQLRYADWRVFSGQFFTSWRPEKDGMPYHVQDRHFERDSVSWFRSMDWGRSNPGCVLWWACLPDGHYHLAAELKFVDTDPPDVAALIKDIDRELGIERVRYTVSDPALFNKAQETGESISEIFAKSGIPLTRGTNNRLNGAERCRMFLRADPEGVPYLTVATRCRYFARTIPLLQQDDHDPEDVDTSMDDHAYDAWRYGAMSRPAPHRFAHPQRAEGSVGALLDEMREASVGVD